MKGGRCARSEALDQDTLTIFFLVTEGEFHELTKEFRKQTRNQTKINVAPWNQQYLVDIEGLYVEPTLFYSKATPTGVAEKEQIRHYSEVLSGRPVEQAELVACPVSDVQASATPDASPSPTNGGCCASLFRWPRRQPQSNSGKREEEKSLITTNQGEGVLSKFGAIKVLCKGDPGVGKTTLAKKIVDDWAQGYSTEFSLVLLLNLRSVDPKNEVEMMILEQNEWLKERGINEAKLKEILVAFGSRCLLILDGLDEQELGLENPLGHNEDVKRIILRNKLLDCSLFATSRPHTIREIRQHFDTVIKVDGFAETEARKFAETVLKDSAMVEAVLTYNPSDFREGMSLSRNPILLAFMCVLVNEDARVDLSGSGAGSGMCTGEIFAKMVECLYTKFLSRQSKTFDRKSCQKEMKKLGVLAWETMTSGKTLMKRKQVTDVIGEHGFAAGLVIGDQDIGPTTDPEVDIRINWPHLTLQEFLGTVHFVRKLGKVLNIESLLGRNKQAFFLTNPLILHFCLWILFSDQTYFEFKCHRQCAAREKLSEFTAKRMGCPQVCVSDVLQSYPHLLEASDPLTKAFLKHVLSKCEELVMTPEHPTKFLLKVVNLKSIHTVTLHSDCTPKFLPKANSGKLLSIVVGCGQEHKDVIKRFVRTVNKLCNKVERLPCFYLLSHSQSFTDILPHVSDATELHFIAAAGAVELSTHVDEMRKRTFSKLSRVSFCGFNVDNARSVRTLIEKDKLPQLSEVRFVKCQNLAGNVSMLFPPPKQQPPRITHLQFYECRLNREDVEFILSKDCKLPKVRSLEIAGPTQAYALSSVTIQPKSLKQLEILAFARGVDSGTDRSWIEETVDARKLKSLDVSHCHPPMAGLLCILLRSNLHALLTLVLSDCGMKPGDLTSLAKAKSEGRIPRLKSLDVSQNGDLVGNLNLMFDFGCTWNQLEEFDASQRERENVSSDNEALKKLAPHLKVLAISGHDLKPVLQVECAKLERLSVRQSFSSVADILQSVCDAHNTACPNLRTLCVLDHDVRGRASSLQSTEKEQAVEDKARATVERLRQSGIKVFRFGEFESVFYSKEFPN